MTSRPVVGPHMSNPTPRGPHPRTPQEVSTPEGARGEPARQPGGTGAPGGKKIGPAASTHEPDGPPRSADNQGRKRRTRVWRRPCRRRPATAYGQGIWHPAGNDDLGGLNLRSANPTRCRVCPSFRRRQGASALAPAAAMRSRAPPLCRPSRRCAIGRPAAAKRLLDRL
jgi:hypothetical protein